MSSSPSSEEPKPPTVGSPGSGKRRVPADTQAPPRRRDNGRPDAEGGSTEGLTTKSAPRRAPSDKPAQSRGKVDSKPEAHGDASDDYDTLPPSRRAPASRVPQSSHQDNDRAGEKENFGEDPSIEPPPRNMNSKRSRMTKALNAQVKNNEPATQSNSPPAEKCDKVNCQWNDRYRRTKGYFDRARRMLDQKGKALTAAEGNFTKATNEITRVKKVAMAKLNQKQKEIVATKEMLEKARAEIKELKQAGGSTKRHEELAAKQAALQTKVSAEEQKQRSKAEAVEKRRQYQLEAKTKEREHKLAMDGLMTDEERLTREEAKRERMKMMGNVAGMVGNIALEAQKTHGETQKVKMRKDMQDVTAARRQAQRQGATTNGATPAPIRRATATTARPRASPPPPQDEGFE